MLLLLRRYLEALVLRAAPGILNLITLLLIGGWLTTADYGFYSTVLATTGLVSNLIFGPITYATISQYARLDAEGHAGRYERSLVSAALLIGLVVAGLGVIGVSVGLVHWSWIGPVVALGIYAVVQEILHARLALWSFGGAALVQAVLFLVLALSWVRLQPESTTALTAFSISYALAAVGSALLCRVFRLHWPDWRLLSRSVAVGGSYTTSVVSEYGLYLGMRYVIGHFGSPHHLGVFSFSVDLAQRLIGFLVSVAGFVSIPLAFRQDTGGDPGAFRKTLGQGALYAIFLSLAAIAAVMVLRQTGIVPVLNGALFEPATFLLVSAAVVINRVKKLLVDPFAMRRGNVGPIAAGYALSVPVTLGCGVLVMKVYGGRGAELIYLGGYVLAAAITLVALKRFLRDTNESRGKGV